MIPNFDDSSKEETKDFSVSDSLKTYENSGSVVSFDSSDLDVSYDSKDSAPQIEEVEDQINAAIEPFLRKQTSLNDTAKKGKKSMSELDYLMLKYLSKSQQNSANLIRKKITFINDEDYIKDLQKDINKIAREEGVKPKRARLERFEFLKVMKKDELFTVLVGLVPVIKIED